MVAQFTTIGHSNRSLDEFLDMLGGAQVALLIDVRSFPRSRTNPVFNTDKLPDDLRKMQINYLHLPVLGGRRPKQPQVDKDLNAMWRVRSFHNYADYALGDEFAAALDEVVRLGRSQRVADVRGSRSVALPSPHHNRLFAAERSSGRSPQGARAY